MKIFRYSADKIPVMCITLASALDLYIYLFADSVILLSLWASLMLTFKVCICAFNHHHQHVHTFYQTWLNRLLEILYAFHTGISTNAWVLHHNLGHHLNYLDQEHDESAWARADGSKMGVAEYTFTIAITGYLRALKVGMRHRKHLVPFIANGMFVLFILSILIYFRPLQAFFVYVVPMASGYIITCWHTYYHHAGLHTKNHFEASYNITHRWYNLMTGNLGYHTAHHSKQGLHWSKLPEYHAEIASKIPDSLYRAPCIPFKWLPSHNAAK